MPKKLSKKELTRLLYGACRLVPPEKLGWVGGLEEWYMQDRQAHLDRIARENHKREEAQRIIAELREMYDLE